MKGDVKRKSSPSTGKSEVLVSSSSPSRCPGQSWLTGVLVLTRAVCVRSGERGWGDGEGIVSSYQRPRPAEACQAEPVGGCQPWFYLRLVAYIFLGLSEGA